MVLDDIFEFALLGSQFDLRECGTAHGGRVGVNDLGQKELAELSALQEEWVLGQGRSKRGHICTVADGNAVLGLAIAWVRKGSDNYENVLEVGANGFWREGQGAGLLEYDRDQVVAYVTLAGQLLFVVDWVGQQRWHVEHDLLAAEACVNGVGARRVVDYIKASAVAGKS